MKALSQELLDHIAIRLRAMGNPVRLRILHELESGELSVNEILTAVGGSQANISKHLNVLRAADLVTRRREGVNIYYGIADASVLEICRTVCESLIERAAANQAALEQGRDFVLRN